MTLSAKTFGIGQRANATLVATLAYTTLAVVFVLDAVTPETLSIEIAYEGSVVLAALDGTRRSIVRVLPVTLFGEVLAGVLEAVRGASTSSPSRTSCSRSVTADRITQGAGRSRR